MIETVIIGLLVYVAAMLTLLVLAVHSESAKNDKPARMSHSDYASLAALEWRVDSIDVDIKQLESEVRLMRKGVLTYD